MRSLQAPPGDSFSRRGVRRLWADATGTIKSLDTSKDMITLDNGSTYMAPKSVKLSDFKVGEKVTVSYTKAGERWTPRRSSLRPDDRHRF